MVPNLTSAQMIELARLDEMRRQAKQHQLVRQAEQQPASDSLGESVPVEKQHSKLYRLVFG